MEDVVLMEGGWLGVRYPLLGVVGRRNDRDGVVVGVYLPRQCL